MGKLSLSARETLNSSLWLYDQSPPTPDTAFSANLSISGFTPCLDSASSQMLCSVDGRPIAAASPSPGYLEIISPCSAWGEPLIKLDTCGLSRSGRECLLCL